MPWAMESTRTKFLIYLQFGFFHVGVTLAIALSFIIPYAPGLLEVPYVVPVLQVLIGLACLIGLMRIIRAGSYRAGLFDRAHENYPPGRRQVHACHKHSRRLFFADTFNGLVFFRNLFRSQ
jgi:hypothetical protein